MADAGSGLSRSTGTAAARSSLVIFCLLIHTQAVAQLGANSASGSKANLVLVPVVVRDSQGHAVGNLAKGDFRLSDNGNPLEIQQFLVTRPGQQVTLEGLAEDSAQTGVSENDLGALQKHPSLMAPARVVALVFADDRLKTGGLDNPGQGDLRRARVAARRYFGALNPTDRVAIFTSTGETTLDFTSDPALLERALLKLHGGEAVHNTSEAEAQRLLEVLRAVVQRIAMEPGVRTAVLLSPGFGLSDDPVWNLLPDTMGLIDLAIRSGVAIDALNLRGPDASGNGPDDLLIRLSDGTGGAYVRDRNDYDSALRQLAHPPEYRYILGFSPRNPKHDGSLHDLKVSLKGAQGIDVQARRAWWDVRAANQARGPPRRVRRRARRRQRQRRPVHLPTGQKKRRSRRTSRRRPSRRR